MDNREEQEALTLIKPETPPQAVAFEGTKTDIIMKELEAKRTLARKAAVQETGQYPKPGDPLHGIEEIEGHKILTVTATGDPEGDKKEVEYFLDNFVNVSGLYIDIQWPPKNGKSASEAQRELYGKIVIAPFFKSLEEIWRQEQVDIYEWPQIKALSASELEAITPYLKDACYLYLFTESGTGDTMQKILDGYIHISDIANYMNMDTGKTFAEEIIERAQISALEAAGAHSGGDLLRKLNSPGAAKAIFPQKHVVPNNRFANMFAQLVNEGEVDFRVNNKPEIYSKVEVTALDSDGVKLSRKITEYERQVMEAFCTVWKYGHPDHIVSPNIIYRAMTHNPAANFSNKDRDDIIAAVEVLTGTKAKIDATREAQYFHYDIEDPYIKGYILDLTEGGGIANGKKFVKWYIKEEPLVSQYASLAGNQRLTIPGEAYNVTYLDSNAPKAADKWAPVHNSKDRIAIKGYLLRRIYQMRYDESRAKEALRKYTNRRKKDPTLEEKPLAFFRKESRKILYSTVFEDTGLADKGNSSLSEHKKYIKTCLDYWKYHRYISNYHIEEGRKGGNGNAVEITIE